MAIGQCYHALVAAHEKQGVYPPLQGHGDEWERFHSSRTFEVVVITIVRISASGTDFGEGSGTDGSARPSCQTGRFGVGHTGHSASALQDDGCAFTGEACQAWCPRFSSEAASGWGPTGPFNTHVYLTRK